ncbi:class I SAM-dependent methyltransferase [Streptomyces sporangiiformans]|uniref:Class I SAM-dependent methyltransferase n=1 Tax=Streptomyces sporangiiformans TaxID=2315329 RepID=A0A505CY08_9ACTN|nr:class I SAM-dependent methyltransferase [Streptomyces sporangiiformans]TPQ16454.1 class I SAM-dependent methyltransferase [Streptomyces sporangiiformans]
MTNLRHRLLQALHRFNAAHPWDHNAHYHPWILRQLPRRFGRALDVGCGSGDLARLLAVRAAEVYGIDADPEIVDRARELTPAGSSTAPVTYTVANALDGGPGGSYDVITCVAVLHHLPLSEALAGFRGQLRPGGTLVVVGLAREETLGDHLLGLASVPANLAMGWVKSRGRTVPRPVSMTAVTRPAETSFGDIVREARRELPGARLRRRLFWRYTLVWRRA